METEKMKEMITKAGGDASTLPDNLITTYWKKLGEALGVDMSNLPNNLVTTYMQAIIDGYAGGGTGGGSEGSIAVISSENPTHETKIVDVSNLSVAFENATEIENRAFNGDVVGGYSRTLRYVSLPNVKSIGTSSFRSQHSLEKVDAPNVTTISNYAFDSCRALKRVDFPNAVSIGEGAFNNCLALREISLPKAETIPFGCFDGCESLEKIQIPSVKTIGEKAFGHSDGYYNDVLTVIDLPSVTYIESFAFRNNRNLKTIILRTTETVCVCDFTAFEGTPILTGQGNFYVPSVMYEYYRAGYEEAINVAMGGGAFDFLFRKIEDYPEICG